MHLFKEERTKKNNLPPTLYLRNHCTIKIKLIENNYKKISACLNKVMQDLSMKIITDGEGVKKLIKVMIRKILNAIK